MLLLLAACMTAQEYPSSVAAFECSRREECFEGEFAETWADQGECVAERGALYQTVSACYDEYCTFEEAKAGEFLSALRNSLCTDVEDTLGDYESAYVCPDDDSDLLSCLATAYF